MIMVDRPYHSLYHHLRFFVFDGGPGEGPGGGHPFLPTALQASWSLSVVMVMRGVMMSFILSGRPHSSYHLVSSDGHHYHHHRPYHRHLRPSSAPPSPCCQTAHPAASSVGVEAKGLAGEDLAGTSKSQGPDTATAAEAQKPDNGR
jgi:hypothetical protein